MGTDVLRFLRLRDWFYFLVLPVLSWDHAAPDPLRLVVAVLVAGCCLGFAYGWNNLRDAKLDLSVAKNPLAGAGRPGSDRHRVLLLCLTAAALAAGAWLGPIPGAAVAFQLVGSALYSGGPRIKRIPVVGTLTNLWIFCPLAFFCQGPLPWATGLLGFTGLFGVVLVQNQLLHEAMDLDEDLADGVRTTAAILGPTVTAALSGGLGLFAGAITVLMGATVEMPLLFGAAALPITLFSLAVFLRPGGARPQGRRKAQRAVGMATCALAWALYVFGPLVAG